MGAIRLPVLPGGDAMKLLQEAGGLVDKGGEKIGKMLGLLNVLAFRLQSTKLTT